jgi:hypothetical protein
MIPGPDVHGGCNSCAEAMEGAEEPAEAVDCRIFHYPSADWTSRGCCWRDEVACWWTWLQRRSGCYQPLTSPLDSSWFGWASIRVPFLYFHFESNCQHTHTNDHHRHQERNPTQYPPWLRSSSWLWMQSSHAQPDTFNQRLNDENQ